jgi:hypothetical protein
MKWEEKNIPAAQEMSSDISWAFFFWLASSIPPLPTIQLLLLSFHGCCCHHPIIVLVVPLSLSSFSCPRCVGMPLSLSLSSPSIRSCHPSVFVPPTLLLLVHCWAPTIHLVSRGSQWWWWWGEREKVGIVIMIWCDMIVDVQHSSCDVLRVGWNDSMEISRFTWPGKVVGSIVFSEVHVIMWCVEGGLKWLMGKQLQHRWKSPFLGVKKTLKICNPEVWNSSSHSDWKTTTTYLSVEGNLLFNIYINGWNPYKKNL